MTEILFYQLRSTPLEKALPKLMEKVMDAGKHAVVVAASEGMLQRLDEALWSYDAASFLPHGTSADAQAARQPIYLTTREENPNAAQILVITNGQLAEAPHEYSRLLDMFDGHNRDAIEAARVRWRHYKEGAHTVQYHEQQKDGSWRQKA